MGGDVQVDAANNWIAPSALPAGQTIQDVVNNYLTPILPAGTHVTTTATGAGLTTEFDATGKANPLTVTVTTHKTWSALGNLIPGLNLNNMTITVATTMRME